MEGTSVGRRVRASVFVSLVDIDLWRVCQHYGRRFELFTGGTDGVGAREKETLGWSRALGGKGALTDGRR